MLRMFFSALLAIALIGAPAYANAQDGIAGVWRELSNHQWMKAVPDGMCKITLNTGENFYDFQAPNVRLVSRLNDGVGTYAQDGEYRNTYGVWLSLGDRWDYARFLKVCGGLPEEVSFPKELCVDPQKCGPAGGNKKGPELSFRPNFYI